MKRTFQVFAIVVPIRVEPQAATILLEDWVTDLVPSVTIISKFLPIPRVRTSILILF